MPTDRIKSRKRGADHRSPASMHDPRWEPGRGLPAAASPVLADPKALPSTPQAAPAGPVESATVPPHHEVGRPVSNEHPDPTERVQERLAYSVQESADLLGVNYYSVYRLIQRGKLKACRALAGKLLVPQSELLRLLREEVE